MISKGRGGAQNSREVYSTIACPVLAGELQRHAEHARTKAIKTLEQGERFPFSSVQSLYVVELKSSLLKHLA